MADLLYFLCIYLFIYLSILVWYQYVVVYVLYSVIFEETTSQKALLEVH